jgi:hypothetical protein
MNHYENIASDEERIQSDIEDEIPREEITLEWLEDRSDFVQPFEDSYAVFATKKGSTPTSKEKKSAASRITETKRAENLIITTDFIRTQRYNNSGDFIKALMN